MLGVIYHHEGRLAEAEEMFRTALRLNPAYTEAALNLVVTCNDLGKYVEAKTIYEQAMAAVQSAPRELDPFVKGKIANMHAELGATYRAVGVFDEAVREYERALALCPTFADIRTELGKTLREMGELPTSIRELELVRAEQPRYAPGRHPPRAQLPRRRPARGCVGAVAGGAGGRPDQRFGPDVPRHARRESARAPAPAGAGRAGRAAKEAGPRPPC